jgi:hypothetical protein
MLVAGSSRVTDREHDVIISKRVKPINDLITGYVLGEYKTKILPVSRLNRVLTEFF